MPSPIDLTGPTGAPLFATAIEGLAPGATAVIDGNDFGHPVQSLRDVPGGRLLGAAVRQRLHAVRAPDGNTVWLHMDQWEGQDWKRSPGNLYGDPVRVSFDPRATTPISWSRTK